jgi:hypothetical protein
MEQSSREQRSRSIRAETSGLSLVQCVCICSIITVYFQVVYRLVCSYLAAARSATKLHIARTWHAKCSFRSPTKFVLILDVASALECRTACV